MSGMDMLDAFTQGARLMARGVANAHFEYGFTEAQWSLLTQPSPWRPDQVVQVKGLLMQLIQSCLTISRIPATRLSGQFAAALICEVVHTCNIHAAAWSCPDSFDATAAAGFDGNPKFDAMPPEQIVTLCMAILGADTRRVQPSAESIALADDLVDHVDIKYKATKQRERTA